MTLKRHLVGRVLAVQVLIVALRQVVQQIKVSLAVRHKMLVVAVAVLVQLAQTLQVLMLAALAVQVSR